MKRKTGWHSKSPGKVIINFSFCSISIASSVRVVYCKSCKSAIPKDIKHYIITTQMDKFPYSLEYKRYCQDCSVGQFSKIFYTVRKELDQLKKMSVISLNPTPISKMFFVTKSR